jgi:drug/metabolite transporter (DMT)-like permease
VLVLVLHMPTLVPVLCHPPSGHVIHNSSTVISKRALHEIYIVLGTVFYGISIVFAKEAMNINMGPNSFNALQYVVGAVFLLATRKRLKRYVNGDKGVSYTTAPMSPKLRVIQSYLPEFIRTHSQCELLMLGVMCAIPGFLASALNQFGLCSIDAGKSAFLSSLYVVITPLIQYVLQGSNANLTIHTWYSAVVCLIGTYLLSGASFDSIGTGEIVTVFGSFLISLEILLNDYSIERVDCIDLTCVQMCTSMTLCILVSIVLEPDGMYNVLMFTSTSLGPVPSKDLVFWSLVLVVGGGIFEAMAFQLHVVGQMHATGSRAALLFGLEAVVTGIGAYFFLGEILSNIELVGCTMILVSTLIVTAINEADEDNVPPERDVKPLMA